MNAKFKIMKIKIIITLLIIVGFMGFVQAEPFTPTNGTFAFQEVDIHEINGINFTIPTKYNMTHEGYGEMDFKGDFDKIKIKVTDNGKIKKVKSDKSKNISSGKSMLGSVKGYLVNKNGTYTFSYRDDGKLVVIKSTNMPLMIGAIGKD